MRALGVARPLALGVAGGSFGGATSSLGLASLTISLPLRIDRVGFSLPGDCAVPSVALLARRRVAGSVGSSARFLMSFRGVAAIG